jgi:acyl-CoA synthetase (AMP-forming)/AMP-acid ligase II
MGHETHSLRAGRGGVAVQVPVVLGGMFRIQGAVLILQGVAVRLLVSLPKSTAGKILRRELKARQP